MFITNEFDDIRNNNELIDKFIEPKTRKLFKIKKLFKSKTLAKLRKKLSNNKNLSNFGTIKTKLSILISNAKIVFNCL